MVNDDRGLRLVVNDRAADARARIYGRQLRNILNAWDRCEQQPMDVPDLVADLRALADRMEGTTTAGAGSTMEGDRRPQTGAH